MPKRNVATDLIYELDNAFTLVQVYNQGNSKDQHCQSDIGIWVVNYERISDLQADGHDLSPIWIGSEPGNFIHTLTLIQSAYRHVYICLIRLDNEKGTRSPLAYQEITMLDP